MHLIAITEIPNPFEGKEKDDTRKPAKGKLALEFCKTVMHDPMPDYPIDDEENEDERECFRKQIQNYAETGIWFMQSVYLIIIFELAREASRVLAILSCQSSSL